MYVYDEKVEYFKQLIAASVLHNASHVYFTENSPAAIRALGRLEFLKTRKNTKEDIDKLISAVLTSETSRKTLDTTGSAEISMEFDPVHALRIRVVKESHGAKIVVHIKKKDLPAASGIPQRFLQIMYSQKPGMLILGGALHHNKDATLRTILKLIEESQKFHVLVFGMECLTTPSHEGSIISYYNISRANTDLIRFQAADIVIFREITPEVMKVAYDCAMLGMLVVVSMDSISHSCTVLRTLSMFPNIDVGKRFLCENMLGVMFQVLITRASEPSFYLYDFLETNDHVRSLIMCDNIKNIGTVQMVQQLNLLVEKGLVEYYDICPILSHTNHSSQQVPTNKDTDTF